MKLNALLLVLLLPVALPARADNYALIIGIDEYQDRNNINPLGAAAKDAKELAKPLTEVADFPKDNVRLLTSEGEPKPTGSNIVFELGQLAKSVKVGDTVFITFSGHGVESEADETTYLLPYDADARTEATLARTGVSTAEIMKQLKKLPARAVIVALDMCRSDPKKGARDVTAGNRFGKRQAENFRTLVVESAQSGGAAPKLFVTLFACSPGQRSWEWRTKQRGYFSYYLEEGLRRGAADSSGAVRLPNLISYLEKAVPGAVQREEGQEQTPAKFEVGTGAQDVVLAKGRPAGSGGSTAVPVEVGSSAKDRFDAAYQKGLELLKNGRLDAAQLKFEEASEIESKSIAPIVQLAYLAFLRRDWPGAEKHWKRALEIQPSSSIVLGGYASHLATLRDFARSEELYKKAIEAAPDEPINYTGLAVVLVSKQDLDGAERAYRRASELDPKNAEAVAGMGSVRLQKGDVAEGERLLKRALQLDPKNTMVRVYLAQNHLARKDYKEAERLYLEAIALEPMSAMLKTGLGLTLQLKGDLRAAERLLREAVDLDPQVGFFRINHAHVLLLMRDRDEAMREARKAIELGYKQKHPVFDALGLKP